MTNDDSEIFHPLPDMDAWTDFWANNRDALDMDEQTAFALACNQGLLVGGGAAPLIRVGFVD
jgi:hypothetical protein